MHNTPLIDGEVCIRIIHRRASNELHHGTGTAVCWRFQSIMYGDTILHH